MTQFFAWSKLFGTVVALAGGYLSFWTWAALDTSVKVPDLLGPTLWGYPVLDWLITSVGACFGVLAFIYAVAEKRTWTNALFGLPLFGINAFALIVWWSMETGHADVVIGLIVFSITVAANIVASAIFLSRPFAVPAIEAK